MDREPFASASVPTPPPAARRRTPVVTAAGGLLITAGVLTLLAGLIVVLAGSDVLVDGEPIGDAARTLATIAVALGAIDVVTGILVLRLVPLARILGFGLAGLRCDRPDHARAGQRALVPPGPDGGPHDLGARGRRARLPAERLR